MRHVHQCAPARIAVFVAAVVPSLASAQSDTIRATASAWASRPAPGVDTAIVYMERDGARQPMMSYIETITRTPTGYLVVQQNVRPNGIAVTLDTIALAEGTLAPVWHSDVTARGAMRVSFDRGRVRGTSTETGGVVTPVDTAVPRDALDFSVAGSFVRLLPLRVGYSVILAAYDIHRGATNIPVRVIGEEEIEVGGKRVNTWKVEMTTSGRTTTNWIDRASRREVRVTVDAGPAKMVVERRP